METDNFKRDNPFSCGINLTDPDLINLGDNIYVCTKCSKNCTLLNFKYWLSVEACIQQIKKQK